MTVIQFFSAVEVTDGVNPVIASPKTNHALSEKVLQTEADILESYQCLMMCQLEPRCQSFNFSKRWKICEMSSATKREFPRNFFSRADYNYYDVDKAVSMKG